ncbi:hypothetical protein Bca101_055068 [Brassica carinata]
MSAKELAWSLPFLLFVTAPLGFEDYPYDGATGFKASLPSCCSSCFEESPVSPPVLHFSTLHRRNLSLFFMSRSIGESVWGFVVESFGSGSARRPPPLVSRSRCQPPPLKPLGATLGLL